LLSALGEKRMSIRTPCDLPRTPTPHFYVTHCSFVALPQDWGQGRFFVVNLLFVTVYHSFRCFCGRCKFGITAQTFLLSWLPRNGQCWAQRAVLSDQSVGVVQVHEELPAFLASLLPVWDGSRTHLYSVLVFEHDPSMVRYRPCQIVSK
jgi:hypothetical protein